MSMIEEAARKIQTITDLTTKEKYIKALRSSVIWDGVEDDRKPTSAASIVAASGLGPSALESNRVLLGKTDLPLYAKEHGLDKTLIAIRKSITASTYKEHFGDDRTEVRDGRKLLLTYAEARSILGIKVRGNMPNV